MSTQRPIRNQPVSKAGFRQRVIRIPYALDERLKKEAKVRHSSISLTAVEMIEGWFADYEGVETTDKKIDKILKIVEGYDFSE